MEDDILNVFNFEQPCCFVIVIITKCKKLHFYGVCCSWISRVDELFLERNASATVCSWTVRIVTALTAIVVFLYFTSVVTTAYKQQLCWKSKPCHLSTFSGFAYTLLVFTHTHTHKYSSNKNVINTNCLSKFRGSIFSK